MYLFTNRSCYSACIRVLPLYPFDLPYFSSQPRKVTICGRHVIAHVLASVRDIKIAEAPLVLCLAYYVMKQVQHCWNWGVMAFTYRDMGHVFHEYILCIFCNGWMDCRDAFHAVLCLYCCIRQNITEYEAYWLMGFPIINLWCARFTSTFSVFSVIWLNGLQGYFSCCSLLILLCNEHKKAEYKAY